MPMRANTEADFWARVHKTEGCWLWTGALHNGYGRFRFEGRTWQAHVLAWTWVNGPVPAGLVLDHVVTRGCGNPACVRPAHLEPVTEAENFRRGRHAKREQEACIHGHAFTPANTYKKPNGMRDCRACRRVRSARARANRKGTSP